MNNRAAHKLWLCVKLARQCSRDSWQHSLSNAQRSEYRRMRRESMQDAREWKRELAQ